LHRCLTVCLNHYRRGWHEAAFKRFDSLNASLGIIQRGSMAAGFTGLAVYYFHSVSLKIWRENIPRHFVVTLKKENII